MSTNNCLSLSEVETIFRKKWDDSTCYEERKRVKEEFYSLKKYYTVYKLDNIWERITKKMRNKLLENLELSAINLFSPTITFK